MEGEGNTPHKSPEPCRGAPRKDIVPITVTLAGRGAPLGSKQSKFTRGGSQTSEGRFQRQW